VSTAHRWRSESNAGGADSNGTAHRTPPARPKSGSRRKDGNPGDQLVGNDSIELRSEYQNVDLRAHPMPRATASPAPPHHAATRTRPRSRSSRARRVVPSDGVAPRPGERVRDPLRQARDAHAARRRPQRASGGSNAPDRRIYWEVDDDAARRAEPGARHHASGTITQKTKNVQGAVLDPVAHAFSSCSAWATRCLPALDRGRRPPVRPRWRRHVLGERHLAEQPSSTATPAS